MGLVPDRHLSGQGFSYSMNGTPDNIFVPSRGVGYSKILYEVISESGKSLPQLRVCTMTATLSEGKLESKSGMEQNPSRIESNARLVSAFLPIVDSDTTDTEPHECVRFSM